MRLLEVARRGAVAIIIYSLFRFSQYPLFLCADGCAFFLIV
nr:MAG TPA: hypothetical protein [Bacteriophage sp.]DAJ69651.1 MAG TPA: hypothetical protein [Caudoviricetes sp.]